MLNLEGHLYAAWLMRVAAAVNTATENFQLSTLASQHVLIF